jgi:hypothetical protein
MRSFAWERWAAACATDNIATRSPSFSPLTTSV